MGVQLLFQGQTHTHTHTHMQTHAGAQYPQADMICLEPSGWNCVGDQFQFYCSVSELLYHRDNLIGDLSLKHTNITAYYRHLH